MEVRESVRDEKVLVTEFIIKLKERVGEQEQDQCSWGISDVKWILALMFELSLAPQKVIGGASKLLRSRF